MAVLSGWGAIAAPYTTPLPAFQPPPGQTRSSSISTPRSMRNGTCSKPPQEQDSWFSARTANAVGITQLTVSGNHGQPNLSGSKRTCRSAVRNFHFQNQFDSFPAQLMSQ